ncbi:procollagen galactosyltransferase 2-like [Brevipalpus obovatus]|uniref:procollagen galactosyltransferase 2-like n=1 Tax=Brevipalpus obovatus TaxID=246614 RepID=UPI003D9DF0A3
MNEIYIINSKRRPQRLNRMMKALNLLGVDAKVSPAVDGRELSKDYLIENNIALMGDCLDSDAKMPMKIGEVGCFLSHYQIWQEVVERNYSRVIIFEHDVRFEREFRTKWMKHLEHLEGYISSGGKVDFVYLGRMVLVNRTEEKAPVEGFVFSEYSYWGIGYMLTPTGAQKLIDALPLQKMIAVDEYIPILYRKNLVKELSEHSPNRTLIAFSSEPLLIHSAYFLVVPTI